MESDFATNDIESQYCVILGKQSRNNLSYDNSAMNVTYLAIQKHLMNKPYPFLAVSRDKPIYGRT